MITAAVAGCDPLQRLRKANSAQVAPVAASHEGRRAAHGNAPKISIDSADSQ